MASDAPPHPSFLFTGKLNLDFNPPQNDEDDEVDVDDDDVDEDSNSSTDRNQHPSFPPPPLPAAAPPVSASPTAVSALAAVKKSPAPPYPIDESRKLFQRLWTDEDEIELLQGFLDYNTQRGSSNQHHHDTTAFYDQIKSKLQLEFNKNQLVEKLRRLKKKYRNVVQKIGAGKEYVFKSPHDQATFEISKKIWGGALGINTANFNTPIKISQSPDEGGLNDEDDDPSPNANLNFSSGLIDFGPNHTSIDEKIAIRPKKRSRVMGVGVGNAGIPQFNHPHTPLSIGVSDQTPNAVATPNVIEETIRSCLSPIFKELLNGVMSLSNGARGVGGLTALATMPLGSRFGAMGNGGVDLAAAGDEKWRKQQILELEVFSKRLELVQDQIKVQLEELRGKGS